MDAFRTMIAFCRIMFLRDLIYVMENIELAKSTGGCCHSRSPRSGGTGSHPFLIECMSGTLKHNLGLYIGLYICFSVDMSKEGMFDIMSR